MLPESTDLMGRTQGFGPDVVEHQAKLPNAFYPEGGMAMSPTKRNPNHFIGCSCMAEDTLQHIYECAVK